MDIQWLLQMPQQKTESEQSRPAPLALRAGDMLTASVLDVEKGNDALLSIGQYKAYARLPLPVVTGQDVRIRVEATGGNLRLIMVPQSGPSANGPSGESLEIRLFEPVSDKPGLAAHSRSLVSGESFNGRVTGFEKDGLMLVDFGRFKAFAKIDIPVRQGQTIPLTVVKNDNGIAFAVGPNAQPMDPANLPANSTAVAAASSPPPTASEIAVLRGQIQHLLDGTIQPGTGVPLSTPIKGALINLQQALNPASPTGDMIDTLVARVRAFVENSGIYFEKRLGQAIIDLQEPSRSMPPAELARHPVIRDLMVNDLKPNLMILKQFLDAHAPGLPEPDRHMLETLRSVVQRAVSHIDQQQFMATEKPADPDLLQAFSHLLFLTDTHRNARLKVYYAKKGRDDAHKNPRVSLLLEMDRMGTVRSDLWMVGKDLNITFFVKEAQIKTAIESEHHHIQAMLKDTFNTVAVSVVVNQKKIAEFDGEDLTLPNRRQVDLSI